VRALFAIFVLSSTPAVATSQANLGREPLAIGVSGGWFMLGGRDFQPTDDALGAEGNVSVHVLGPLYLGLGGHYSSHGTFVSAPLRITGVFFEPQAAIGIGPNTLVRLSTRGGWVHRSIEVGTSTYKSSGYGFGAAAAAAYRLAGPLALEAAVSLDFISLDNLFPPGDSDTGTVFAVHMGCRLAFGSRELAPF
jgi:hypothetical protein